MANSGPIHKNFHLFRLRVPNATWDELDHIAAVESARKGEFVCNSDIARFAINDWIASWKANERLGALEPPNRSS